MTSQSPPLKLALFGLGRWGTHLLRNFLALPGADVVAIVDASPERLAQARRQFALSDQVQSHECWATALASAPLNAVVVATPASTHYPIIKAALEQRLHVLSEKPMTLDSASSHQLCQLAAAQERQLVVDHTYLFHPAVQRGYEICQRGSLGHLRYAYAARTNLGPVRPDVDAFWDLAIHDVSILNYWLGQMPTHVSAWGTVWLQTQAQPYFPNGLRDAGWARLTYPNGLDAMIHVSWLNPDKQRRLGLVGNRGTLVLDEMAQDLPLTLYQGRLTASNRGFVPDDLSQQHPALTTAEPLEQLCRHFLDCVQTNRPSALSSGQVGKGLVQIMEAISQAAETGDCVLVQELGARS